MSRVALSFVCVFAGITTHCASTDLDHLAVTNYVDRTIVPDNKVAQWAMTPALIPLTLVTLSIDNLIVAPAANLPSAGGDARKFFDFEIEGYYSSAAIFPFQVALTPVVFVGAWFGRTFFAIDTRYEAAWGWPEWGRQWQREDGRLIGPPGTGVREEPGPVAPETQAPQ